MPRDFPRSRRIEDQIQRILSDLLRTEVRDPRLGNVIITAVRVSKDLSVAWVYYTVLQLGDPAESLDSAFDSAMGFLRGRLAKDLTVRRVPELRFRIDETQENARNMDELIRSAVDKDRKGRDDEPSEND
jgi:ribosome-binding factor A